MRTLHVGLRVTDLERSITFYHVATVHLGLQAMTTFTTQLFDRACRRAPTRCAPLVRLLW